MLDRLIAINGELVKYQDATIHISSVAMKYGASVFEGVRGYLDTSGNSLNIFAVDQHIKRLMASIKLMKMEFIYNEKCIIESIAQLIKTNKISEDCYIRCAVSIIGTGGIDCTGPTMLSIDAFPQGRKPNQANGINVSISSWRRINDNSMPPRLKCIANYQNGRMATLQAKASGYDNTLLLNEHGKISEAPTACVFFLKNGRLITAPVTADILESITRNFIISFATDIGVKVVEREIDRTEAYLAD